MPDESIKLKETSELVRLENNTKREPFEFGTGTQSEDRSALYQIAKALAVKKGSAYTVTEANSIEVIEAIVDDGNKTDQNKKLTRAELDKAMIQSGVTIVCSDCTVTGVRQGQGGGATQSGTVNATRISTIPPAITSSLDSAAVQMATKEYLQQIVTDTTLNNDQKAQKIANYVFQLLGYAVKDHAASRPTYNIYYGNGNSESNGAGTGNGQRDKALASVNDPDWAKSHGISTADVKNLLPNQASVVAYNQSLTRIQDARANGKITDGQLDLIIARIVDWKKTGDEMLADITGQQTSDSTASSAQRETGDLARAAILNAMQRNYDMDPVTLSKVTGIIDQRAAVDQTRNTRNFDRIKEKALLAHLDTLFNKADFGDGKKRT
jgi:hypothetical protein